VTPRAQRPLRRRIRSSLFLFPAWFSPSSALRVAFHRLRGVDIGPNVEIGYLVLIDHLYPERVHIARGATVSARSTILAHDEAFRYARGEAELVEDTYISEAAFVGVHCVVLPGVEIGTGAVVGAGAVVTSDVPAHSVVAGVPARIIPAAPSRRPGDGPDRYAVQPGDEESAWSTSVEK